MAQAMIEKRKEQMLREKMEERSSESEKDFDTLAMDFDFDGYLLFDNLAPSPSDEDIFAALELNSAQVVHKRCFFYREHFRKKRCAVVKYISNEIASNVLKSHNERILFEFKVHVFEIKRNLSQLAEIERSLLECFPEMVLTFKTDVLILNIDDSTDSSGDAYSRAVDLLTRFGPIKDFHILGRSNQTFGNFLIRYETYSSALAAHIAYNNTVINGRMITVAVHRMKFQTIHNILHEVEVNGNVGLKPQKLSAAIPLDLCVVEDGVHADEGAAEELEQSRQAPEQDTDVASTSMRYERIDEEIWCVNSDASLVAEVQELIESGIMSELTGHLNVILMEQLNPTLGRLIQREPAATFFAYRERVAAVHQGQRPVLPGVAHYQYQGAVGPGEALYMYQGPVGPGVALYMYQGPVLNEAALCAYDGPETPFSTHGKLNCMIKEVQAIQYERSSLTPAGINLELFVKQLNDDFASFTGEYYLSDLQSPSKPESVTKQHKAAARKLTKKSLRKSKGPVGAPPKKMALLRI